MIREQYSLIIVARSILINCVIWKFTQKKNLIFFIWVQDWIYFLGFSALQAWSNNLMEPWLFTGWQTKQWPFLLWMQLLLLQHRRCVSFLICLFFPMHFTLLYKQLSVTYFWVCFLVWIVGYSEIYASIILVLVILNKCWVKFFCMFTAGWIVFHAFLFDAVFSPVVCFKIWR